MPESATLSVSTNPPAAPPRLRFSWMELSGSLGDLGTFLPLVVAMALSSGMDLGVVLVCAGVMNIVTGLWFGQPVPVQPMKAIAAVAITEGLGRGAITAAGLGMGAMLVALAMVGAVGWLSRWVPRAVVRGIQLGVGMKLVLQAAEMLLGLRLGAGGAHWGAALPWWGPDSLIVAAATAAMLLGAMRARVPLLLVVFAGGFGLLYLKEPGIYRDVHLSWPGFGVGWPSGVEWWAGLTRGAIPQLPLTLLNSVVAVCGLSEDLFPGRGIRPRIMAASVGAMNLVSVPLGGAPVCHGAGGLAAQYQFGARTGGSVVMLGAMKVAAGLLLGGTLVKVLGAYPQSVLAVMLVFAGLGLAAVARDSRRGVAGLIVLATAGPIVAWNTTAGFLCGVAAAMMAARLGWEIESPRRQGHQGTPDRR